MLQREPASARESGRERTDARVVRAFASVGTAVLVVSAMSLARAILIPFVLALFLAFLLSPLVSRIERRGAGKILSVVIVAVLAFSALAMIGYGIVRELSALGNELPRYAVNVHDRVAGMRDLLHGSAVRKVESVADVILHELERGPGSAGAPASAAGAPRAVVVSPESSVLWPLPPVLSALSSAGFVAVLVLFTLLERRELRNRLLRIAGHAHLAVTTRALDEAAQRISRYLVAQTAINASFGLWIGIGLHLIGVPYALLCGFVAAVMRFLPYVGPLVGSTLPIALALAVLPGWSGPLSVLALLAVGELACSVILEPWLYGQSAGVSPVALLLAVAFWTWLWGPVGLVVATPLTVCLVVASRHVPELEFLSVLLTLDEPLDLGQRLYQRLLAGDADEAREIVGEFQAHHPGERVYDELVIPVLVQAGIDRERTRLSAEDEARFLRAAGLLVDRIAAAPEQRPPAGDGDAGGAAVAARVAIYPAAGESDGLATRMLRELIRGPAIELADRPASPGVTPGAAEPPPTVACVIAITAAGLRRARRLARRIRRRVPEVAIVVVAWRGGSLEPPAREAGPDRPLTRVVGSLLAAREQVWQIGGLPAPVVSTSAL